jgi:hypothetical protein
LNVSPQEAQAELAKRELARRHFRDFCRYIYDGYLENWHTQLICDALERVLAGEIRFLMIEAPPRHSKSIHVSQLFPAFAFGKDEDTSVIVASYCRRILFARVWSQALMRAAQIVVRNVQVDRRKMVRELLAEAVGEPRESSRRHADREIAALDVAGADFGRHANTRPCRM